MANMLDYIFWRGNLSFSQDALNEVDALILCQLAYARLKGLLPADFARDAPTLREAESRFCAAPDYEERSQECSRISQETVGVLAAAAKSRRFGDLRVTAHADVLDTEQEEQFSATTFVSDAGWAFIAFRGTDDTFVGWKEDFNLGVRDVVPAQRDALRYLEQAARQLDCALYVGGHSKGGNLALYAACGCPASVSDRLLGVYNNDGPGFSAEFFTGQSYLHIRDRVHTFVPELSVVGMLFDHDDRYVTVKSDGRGLMQHDPLSWHVGPGAFEVLPDTNGHSKFIGATVNGWFNELSAEQKRLFVETVFGILQDSEATTNTELTENWWLSLPRMVKAAASLDSKTRDAVIKTVQLLLKNARETARQA